jgi:glycerol-3-phosphate acyltransferase PlsY
MQIALALGMILLAYLIGSVPFGLLIVRLKTGKDIRKVESGRTGGTNAARAAGFGAGLATAILDALKAAAAVWIAQAAFPYKENPAYTWIHIFAGLAAIFGHNYSIFLATRDENGRFKLRGGAGGAPCVGGSLGLWPASPLIIVPLAALILFGVGYASVATMSAALFSTLLFTYLALVYKFPWQYAVYGLLAEVLLAWALRPNIQRLLKGNERLVGWRARRAKRADS